MAIRKEDVLSSVAQEVKAFCDEAEEAIDKKLKYFIDEGITVIYYSEIGLTSDLPGYSQIQKEIVRRYTDAGWSVAFNSDQRDGSWFSFR